MLQKNFFLDDNFKTFVPAGQVLGLPGVQSVFAKMTQRLPYFVIFYSSSVLETMRVNLGVVLIAPDSKSTHVRFIDDWESARFGPCVDRQMLRAICRDKKFQEMLRHAV